MGNPVTWFEINSRNSVALRGFYANLFGWQMEPYPEGPPYAVVDTVNEGAIGGGIGEAEGPSRVLFYIEVDDPQAYLDRILKAGGTSFDSLYVDVNGESGYFERSLDVYGRRDEPCRRCGTPIRREPFMNRSSYFCPSCQPRPRRGRW